MRRYWVVALAALTLLGVLSPPAFAQAPAPKVTISGFIATYGQAAHNIVQGPGTGQGNFDLERTKDHTWNNHTRARFFLTAELGKAKGVLGLEIDEAWGQIGATDNVNANANTIQMGNTNGAFDLGADTTGIIEIKQLYVEFPVPLIPFPTTAKVGGVPFSATYKTAALFASEAGGVDLSMVLHPMVKWNFSYMQVEEDFIGNNPTTACGGVSGTACARGDDFAIVTSFDITPMKGLEIRPIYSFFSAIGPTSGAARTAAVAPLAAVTIRANDTEQRHTLGAEARWRSGPWTLQPTVLWQLGAREGSISTFLPTNQNTKADINAFLVDVEGSYRMGPWLFDARYVYTSGNRPMDRLDKDINYFQPIITDAAYWADWGDIWGAGQVDNFGGCVYNMCQTIGFERFGRQGFAVGATYSVTPDLDLDLVVSPMWTARSVNTKGSRAATGAISCPAGCDGQQIRGDESYLGTDLSFKLIWRFAPGLQARLGFAYLFAGPAFDIHETQNGVRVKNDANDAYYAGWMVQYNF